MKTLLQPKILLALTVTLAASAAVAGDLPCTFYPKQGGLIEGYVAPTPVEDANGRELIEKLAPNEIFSANPSPSVQGGVALAREGNDTWAVRQAGAGKTPALYASVHGPSSVAPQWHHDYHRALNKVLLESLRRGVKIDIVTQGTCR